jgi:hypothetical protein
MRLLISHKIASSIPVYFSPEGKNKQNVAEIAIRYGETSHF